MLPFMLSHATEGWCDIQDKSVFSSMHDSECIRVKWYGGVSCWDSECSLTAFSRLFARRWLFDVGVARLSF